MFCEKRNNGEVILKRCPQGKGGSINILNGVTEIDKDAFKGCFELTSVTVPNSVTYIDVSAFSDCKNINVTYKDKTYDYEHINDLYNAINGN